MPLWEITDNDLPVSLPILHTIEKNSVSFSHGCECQIKPRLKFIGDIKKKTSLNGVPGK
jgi:hypothetical protein